ncbi:MAG: hypothetical protein KatS3mg031_2933 [Chitinophagales bacterium]|nr:MAG: hypothetical protein KatS3mg031_2933 [Chitinophagales bacterium]
MLLVSVNDFVFPYSIPNADRIGALNDLMIVKQDEVLNKIFGVDFTQAFYTGLQAPSPEQRWLDLRDGKTFTLYSKTVVYPGIKSVIVPYVFAKYVREMTANFTGIGTVRPDAENATVISAAHVEVKAYNEAVDASRIVQDYVVSDGRYSGYDICPLCYMNVFGL